LATGDFLDLYGLALRAARRDPTLASDITQAKSAINEAQFFVLDEAAQLDFLAVTGTQALVIGQEAYSYATIATSLGVPAIQQVVSIFGNAAAGAASFHYLGFDDYVAVKALDPATANGVPHIWTITADANVLMWPKPAAALATTIMALRSPVELVADVDVSIIPLAWRRRLLVTYAAMVLLRQKSGIQAVAEAERYWAQFEDALKAFIAAHTLPGPVPQPTPQRLVLPLAYRGVDGTFLDLAQRACYAAGLRPWMQQDLVRAREAVNEAQRHVSEIAHWTWTEAEGAFNTVATQSDYSYAAIATGIGGGISVSDVYELRTAGGQTMNFMEYGEFGRLQGINPALTSATASELWTKFSRAAVRLFATPSAVFAVRALVRRTPTTLVADTDAPLIPIEFRSRVIVPYAAALLRVQQLPATPEAAPEGGQVIGAERDEHGDYQLALTQMRAAYERPAPLYPVLARIRLPAGLQGVDGTFLDLAQRACYAAGLRPWSDFDLARAREAVNEAQLYICDREYQLDFLVTQGTQALVIGQEAYSYATIATSLGVPAINQVIGLGQPASAPEFSYLPWDEYQGIKAINPLLANATPNLWTATGDTQILLWPKPAAASLVTVLALRAAVSMVADADVSVIPLPWRKRLMIPYAATILLRQKQDQAAFAEAERYWAQFTEAHGEFVRTHQLPGPLPLPSSQPAQLPSGLVGQGGSFLDLAQRALYLSGLKVWNAFVLARAKEAVNSAYLGVLGAGDDWDFLQREASFTSVAGTDVYSYATLATGMGITQGIAEILAMVNDTTASRTLQPLPWESLERLAASTQDSAEARGEPVYWAKWGAGALAVSEAKIRLYPSPIQAYALRSMLRVKGAELVADTDVPLIPIDWRYELVVPLAAARLLDMQNSNLAATLTGASSYRVLRATGSYAQALHARAQAALRDMRLAHGTAKAPQLISVGFPPDAEVGPAWGAWDGIL
jgi:hypothetical protein